MPEYHQLRRAPVSVNEAIQQALGHCFSQDAVAEAAGTTIEEVSAIADLHRLFW